MDISCQIKQLPTELVVAAAKTARQINPANAPARFRDILPPEHLALLTSKYWGPGGVRLTVSFLDSPPADLRARILQHMNAWGAYCNVQFTATANGGQVRILRGGDGYWSYLGPDILHISPNEPTMNLQGFTMQTPESEFHRVVRHETGHTLGFPHEHMRRQLVQRLDPMRTITYFLQTQGWSPQVTQQQVLTPLEESSIRGTQTADQDSIMCYQLPGSITVDGQPIRGGVDIDPLDQQFAATLYPLPVAPPPPPPPPPPVKPPPNPPTNGGNVLQKILALIAAVKAQDWLTVLRLLVDLATSMQNGTISATEVAETEKALKAAAPK